MCVCPRAVAARQPPSACLLLLQVLEVSCRLLKLQALLGVDESNELDLVWMVTREPKLLTFDEAVFVQRLLELKVRRGDLP